jgi:superfamily I DNA and/or RNA helicase
MSDAPAELGNSFVYEYSSNLERQWQDLRKQLLKSHDINRYEHDSRRLVSKMREQIPSISLREIETALQEVNECFEKSADAMQESMQESEPVEEERAPKQVVDALTAVTRQVRILDQQAIVQDRLNSADVIFCTLSTTGNRPMRRMNDVSDLIVDEAGACTEAEILVPLNKKPKRLLLVGDPKQLPATVQSPNAVKFGLTQSLQERLMYQNKFDFTLLDVQYRMRPEISQWPMAQFYDAKVQNGANVTHDTYRSEAVLLTGDPYSWVRVAGEEQKNKKMSTLNESEGEAVVAILLEMVATYKLPNGWFSPDRIRIITFYKAQEDYLRLKLRQYNLDVMVSTVDASQGCDADMVILSFVRGTSGHMGFLKDIQRLNVAMTRAKFQLVCVGNVDAIAGLAGTGGNLVLRAMAKDALTRSKIVPAPGPLPPPPKRLRRNQPAVKKAKKKKKKKS